MLSHNTDKCYIQPMGEHMYMLLLCPFVVWDATLYILVRRGDRCPRRRAQILRHFSETDISIGRALALKRNQLFPLSRALFYLFFGALLFGGLGARSEQWLLGMVGGSWLLALPLFVLLLLLGRVLLSLPLAAYAEFVIQRRAELSNITVPRWITDQVKGLCIGWIFASMLAFPVVALVRALPGWWPAPATAAILAVTAFAVWIYPWVIAPWFNRFTPLEDEELERQVRELSRRAGITVDRVFVADASERVTMLNAYFTGLGNSRRVVLYDTLVEACGTDEVLSVVGHEAGHWRGRHIAKGFVMQALGTVGGLLALQVLLDSPSWREFFGLPEPHSLVLLVLVTFLGSLASTAAAPLGAAISRRFERHADRTAFELTEDPAAFVRLEQRLMRRAKADLLLPRLVHAWYGSHPLPEDRIAAAEEWNREAEA